MLSCTSCSVVKLNLKVFPYDSVVLHVVFELGNAHREPVPYSGFNDVRSRPTGVSHVWSKARRHPEEKRPLNRNS